MSLATGEKIDQARSRRLQSSIPASYTFYKDGTTYRAESCLSGGTDYSGTVASTVINAAIASLGLTGGGIFFKPGEYSLNNPIIYPTYGSDSSRPGIALWCAPYTATLIPSANKNVVEIEGPIHSPSFTGFRIVDSDLKQTSTAAVVFKDAAGGILNPLVGDLQIIDCWKGIIDDSATNQVGNSVLRGDLTNIYICRARLGQAVNLGVFYDMTFNGVFVDYSGSGALTDSGGVFRLGLGTPSGAPNLLYGSWVNNCKILGAGVVGVGFRIWNIDDLWLDHCYSNVMSYGFTFDGIVGGTDHVYLNRCHSSGNTHGFRFEAGASGNVHFLNCQSDHNTYGYFENAGSTILKYIRGGAIFGNATAPFIGLVVNTLKVVDKVDGFNPIGRITNPFTEASSILGYPAGATAVPTASKDYAIVGCDVIISSANSGNADNAILIKDPSGNQVNPSALSTLDAYYVPCGYKVNWGAFTGAAGAVVVCGL